MSEAVGREVDFDPAMNEVKVEGDKQKLKQVFINLVRNAFEAIPKAETVKLQIEINTNLNQVCIHVYNGTEPIFPEILPDLTQQFYSTKYFGTWLGLAIIKYILEVHSGELLIKENLAECTRFSVQLPIVTA